MMQPVKTQSYRRPQFRQKRPLWIVDGVEQLTHEIHRLACAFVPVRAQHTEAVQERNALQNEDALNRS